MRCLTVRQPSADDIVAGRKTVEYRPWRTDWRGVLAVHAAAKPEEDEVEVVELNDLPLGCVVGCVILADITYCEVAQVWEWHLTHPTRFLNPEPAQGKLGLWEWHPAAPPVVHVHVDRPEPPLEEPLAEEEEAWEKCSACGATGGGDDSPCTDCNGTGWA